MQKLTARRTEIKRQIESLKRTPKLRTKDRGSWIQRVQPVFSKLREVERRIEEERSLLVASADAALAEAIRLLNAGDSGQAAEVMILAKTALEGIYSAQGLCLEELAAMAAKLMAKQALGLSPLLRKVRDLIAEASRLESESCRP